MTLNIGDKFDTLSNAREAIKQHIIERGESFKVLKGEQSKLHVVVCIEKTCNFRIRVPIIHQEWKPAHSVSYFTNNHRAAVADNQEVKPKQLQSSERLQFGNTISYQQAYRTQETLRAEIEGDKTATFKKFPALFNAIEALDTINGICLNIDDNNKFQYCFIATVAI
ncbi:MAG: hypothetical protein M1840_006872 [Geoglossum simile]|nr:MAG: hypothetical protein M1840_006872 [Geoglossum simile]